MENEIELAYEVHTTGKSWNETREILNERVFSFKEKKTILPKDLRLIYKNSYEEGRFHYKYKDLIYQFKDSLDTILEINVIGQDACQIKIKGTEKNVNSKSEKLEEKVKKFDDIFLEKYKKDGYYKPIGIIISDSLKKSFDIMKNNK